MAEGSAELFAAMAAAGAVGISRNRGKEASATKVESECESAEWVRCEDGSDRPADRAGGSNQTRWSGRWARLKN